MDKKCVSFDGFDTVELGIFPGRTESPKMSQQRQEMKRLFEKLDQNRNGYVEIKELKMLIKSIRDPNLPKGFARRLLKLSDTNRDGRLDFEEFYEMSKTYDYMLTRFINAYCTKLVPPRRNLSTDLNKDQIDNRYEENISCCPPPITMLIFSLIEIFTFLVDVWYKDEHKTEEYTKLGLITDGPLATVMMYDPLRRYEIWRFITYMFVHAGTSHLTANLVIQLFLGTVLELFHCWWRIVCIYLAGVLAASFGTSIWNPTTKFCGASGGVYALITAHIATVILNWSDMEFPGIQLFVFVFYCTVDLGQSIYNHIMNDIDQVGYFGHLCGAVAGLLVGIGVLQNLNVKSWEIKLWWTCVTIYLVLMFSGIYVHVLYPEYFPSMPTISTYKKNLINATQIN